MEYTQREKQLAQLAGALGVGGFILGRVVEKVKVQRRIHALNKAEEVVTVVLQNLNWMATQLEDMPNLDPEEFNREMAERTEFIKIITKTDV